MKKIMTILMLLCLCGTVSACTNSQNEETTIEQNHNDDMTGIAEGVMNYEQYTEAEDGAAVVMDMFVKEVQAWEDGRALISMRDEKRNPLLFEGICPEDDYEKLMAGVQIRVFGYKAGIEGMAGIADATLEIIE